MPQSEQFDALVLGSGTGGKLVAWHMARLGRRTAVVERRWVGGACPNVACMPSKNEIGNAKVAHLARHGGEHGAVTGPVTVDMATVRRRKREMVDRQIGRHLQMYRESGAELIMGSGSFVAAKTLEVKLNDGGTRVLEADEVFLNVGTHAAIPNLPGLKEAGPLTHVEALELEYLPRHLIVVGGGYSGLELAQAYRRFGAEVTIVEAGPQLLAREDIDVSLEMRRILDEEGIQVLVGAELLQVSGRSGDQIALTARCPSGEQRIIDGSDILVAVGRVPNTAGIGLEQAGVELDGRGFVRVNDRLETSAPDVWAVGECAGSPQFTHISEDDFRVIRDNLAGGNRTTRDRLVPYCMFTDPPLARVGLSEGEAGRQGVMIRVAKLPMDAVLGAQATDQRTGFMKALIGDSHDRILGFTMIGAAAGEVMATVQTAMLAGLSYPVLGDADFAHPTMVEGLSFLFSNVPPRPAQQSKSDAEGNVRSGRLFLLELSGDRIHSMNPDGSDRKAIVTGCHLPDGIIVDAEAGHIYWTNMGVPNLDDGSIERADLDGGNRTVIVPQGVTHTPKQIHLDKDNGKLYWCDGEGMRVMRANLDGSQAETLVETGRGDNDRRDPTRWCVGVTIDPELQKLYWTQKGPSNGGQGRILRANIDLPKGASPANRPDVEVLFDQLPEPIDLELDLANRVLYWTDRGDPPRGNTVNRVAIDKQAAPEILVTHLMEGIGVALDVPGNRMFVTDFAGSVYAADLDGGSERVLIARQGNLTGVAYAEIAPATHQQIGR